MYVCIYLSIYLRLTYIPLSIMMMTRTYTAASLILCVTSIPPLTHPLSSSSFLLPPHRQLSRFIASLTDWSCLRIAQDDLVWKPPAISSSSAQQKPQSSPVHYHQVSLSYIIHVYVCMYVCMSIGLALHHRLVGRYKARRASHTNPSFFPFPSSCCCTTCCYYHYCCCFTTIIMMMMMDG